MPRPPRAAPQSSVLPGLFPAHQHPRAPKAMPVPRGRMPGAPGSSLRHPLSKPDCTIPEPFGPLSPFIALWPIAWTPPKGSPPPWTLSP